MLVFAHDFAQSTPNAIANYGVAYAAFRKNDPSVKRGVVVVVLDPKSVRQQLGMALGLVDKYRALPAAFRDPIDRQFQSRTGFTISSALDPSSPLGMTLTAVRQLQTSDQRAIVVLDGTKK